MASHGRHCSCSACAREDWTRITAMSSRPESLSAARHRAEVIAALKRELACVHEEDRAEALGPHPMVGRIDCELCGEGVCHYMHITEREAWGA